MTIIFCVYVAGKKVTDDEVEQMLESDNPAIFTQDVCQGHFLRILRKITSFGAIFRF